jgi:ferredoxin--NADP+ reductase
VSTPCIAVIGSGPSGLYTVAALLASGALLHVDVIDRLPTPCGLVRYGVAPDHARMKAVTRVLAKPFSRESVRYLGNVEVRP